MRSHVMCIPNGCNPTPLIDDNGFLKSTRIELSRLIDQTIGIKGFSGQCAKSYKIVLRATENGWHQLQDIVEVIRPDMTVNYRKWSTVSSSIFRIFVFIFLRWIPGHHFLAINTSFFLIYAVSFYHATASVEGAHERSKFHDAKQDANQSNEHAGQEQANGKPQPARSTKSKLLPKPTFKTIFTGGPSSSAICNLVSLTTNICLLSFVLYYVYIPIVAFQAHGLSFARVGYVSDNRANILSRAPQQVASGTLSYKTSEPGFKGQSKEILKILDNLPTDPRSELKTDRTTTIVIPNLVPDTRYYYNITYFDNRRSLLESQTGHFITAPQVGTFSKRGDGKFTFVYSSCLMKNFPFNPAAHPLSIHGFRYLASWLGSLRPSFMLFLGDFIYIDVPLRYGSDEKTYQRHYRQVYGSPEWPSVSRVSSSTSSSIKDSYEYDLPWIHTYDDHEIANDWSANTTGHYPQAFNPYLHYHLNANPPLPAGPIQTTSPQSSTQVKTAPFSIPDHQATYTTFNQGPASFFLLDTRRYRKPPTPQKNSTMLGKSQLNALYAWINEPVPPGVHWKFLISSVPFTRNWRIVSQDTWTGYVVERRKILEWMWDYGSKPGTARIVVLSGDRHEVAATAFPPPYTPENAPRPDGPVSQTKQKARWNAKGTVHEFSSSPLSQFYLPLRTYIQDKPPARLGGNASIQELEAQQEEDISIGYLPYGNSKFGLIEIEKPTASGVSLLRYRAFIDGKERWSHVLTSGGPGQDGSNADPMGNGREMWKERV